MPALPMKRTPAIALIVVLFPSLFAGCVIHAPISESVIFHDPSTTPQHTGRAGLGVQTTVSPARKIARELARRDYPERTSHSLVNPNRISAGLYAVWYQRSGRFAISLSVGALASGIDATAQVYGRTYVTAVASLGGLGLYVQHRLFNSPMLGLAAGLGLEESVFTIGRPSDCTTCLFFDYSNTTILSLRGFAIYRQENTDVSFGIKLGLTAGYVFALREPVFGVTLNVGRY